MGTPTISGPLVAFVVFKMPSCKWDETEALFLAHSIWKENEKENKRLNFLEGNIQLRKWNTAQHWVQSLLYYMLLIYAVIHVFICNVKFQVLHDTILFCINDKSMGYNSFGI